jgi:6-phosphogluconolactonase/glucosamine-6-phosphate isomerase/deaminase
MKFIKQTEGLPEALAQKLNQALAEHRRVVWLVSGGSNVAISAEAMRLVNSSTSPQLVVMQVDERFVAPDSPDSNWKQLLDAGFDTGKATCYPVLNRAAKTLEETAAAYAEVVAREFEAADYIIGQFGVGSDGHVAGIKPHSPAVTSEEYVTGYPWDDFQRVTLTFPAIRRVDAACSFIFGGDKRPVLDRLSAGSSPLEDFPAGVLCEILDSTVYNDYIAS